jgi:hypothetical protein
MEPQTTSPEENRRINKVILCCFGIIGIFAVSAFILWLMKNNGHTAGLKSFVSDYLEAEGGLMGVFGVLAALKFSRGGWTKAQETMIILLGVSAIIVAYSGFEVVRRKAPLPAVTTCSPDTLTLHNISNAVNENGCSRQTQFRYTSSAESYQGVIEKARQCRRDVIEQALDQYRIPAPDRVCYRAALDSLHVDFLSVYCVRLEILLRVSAGLDRLLDTGDPYNVDAFLDKSAILPDANVMEFRKGKFVYVGEIRKYLTYILSRHEHPNLRPIWQSDREDHPNQSSVIEFVLQTN